MQRKEIFVILFCIFLGFVLRFYAFDQKSLWLDEIHTFNDSRPPLEQRLKFYANEPTYFHPPLFFLLTHLFYPFSKPERDLRILPLVFGTLSIPMIYLLSKSFSPNIALPCSLSLSVMFYHISLSQDGRSYSLIMFLGMGGLYFFMKHLKTYKKSHLLVAAIFYTILFYTSYSTIPYIALSQVLWFYRKDEDGKKPILSSFLTFNGTVLVLSLPWILFLALHYRGQPLMNPVETQSTSSIPEILYWIFHDWFPHMPLIIASMILLFLLPFFLRDKRNALLLLSVLILPVIGVYLICRLFHLTHFVASKYFINLLPLFLIALYLSLNAINAKVDGIKKRVRLDLLFIVLFLVSNLIPLPLYYRSEKQDLRGLVTYLKGQLRQGDKIFIGSIGYIPGILHYFEATSEDRHQIVFASNDVTKEAELRMNFMYKNVIFTVYQSKRCCTQYVANGNRLWIIVGKEFAEEIKKGFPFVLKGFFDGSFFNLNKFPMDESIYLFLWNPQYPEEKGIDWPIQ